MTIKFLDLNYQYNMIKNEIDLAIKEVISNTAFIGGKYVQQFEGAFANYVQARHAIGVANGTDALKIAIEALNLPKESEIVVPANSFISSAEAITRSGHKVIFCDCDPNNYTISIPSLRSKITHKTKAVMAVHLYGHPCDMDDLQEIAKEYDLKIIEDCAQAHGAEYKGIRVGAYGDGGAIVTNSDELAKKCRMIANHGRIKKYNHEFEGRNSRLDGLQAAILSVKLKHLDDWTDARINVANYYLKHLKDVKNLILPQRENWAKQVYHLFVIQTEKRNKLKDYLKEHNIQTGIHYPIALPKLQAYTYLGQANEKFFANQVDSQLLSLPIGEHLSEKDLVYISKKLDKF